MSFERIPLPYATDALEPSIDALTIETHYGAHHKTYTEKFNDLIKDVDAFRSMSALEILRNLDKAPENKRNAIRNNGGGYYIHNLYFESLAPAGVEPPAAFKKEVEGAFGSWDSMLKMMKEAATATLFGSGWTWLVAKGGNLEITISANQDLPAADCTLLFPLDMWEHSYYLKYKNKKADYVDNLFKVVNWDVVAARMKQNR